MYVSMHHVLAASFVFRLLLAVFVAGWFTASCGVRFVHCSVCIGSLSAALSTIGLVPWAVLLVWGASQWVCPVFLFQQGRRRMFARHGVFLSSPAAGAALFRVMAVNSRGDKQWVGVLFVAAALVIIHLSHHGVCSAALLVAVLQNVLAYGAFRGSSYHRPWLIHR